MFLPLEVGLFLPLRSEGSGALERSDSGNRSYISTLKLSVVNYVANRVPLGFVCVEFYPQTVPCLSHNGVARVIIYR